MPGPQASHDQGARNLRFAVAGYAGLARCRRSLNCSIFTCPSGNTARISSFPPMAAIMLPSVLTYMSVRRSSLEIADWFTLRTAANCAWVKIRDCGYLRDVNERPPPRDVPLCKVDGRTKYRRARRRNAEFWQCPKHPRECPQKRSFRETRTNPS